MGSYQVRPYLNSKQTMSCLKSFIIGLSFLVALSSCFHLPAGSQGAACMTATEEQGACVQITDCESLDQIFGQHMSKEKITFLKHSGCGFENDIPKICCPIIPVVITKKNIDVTHVEGNHVEDTHIEDDNVEDDHVEDDHVEDILFENNYVTDTHIEETTTSKAPSTIFGVSDEFDFKLRDGFDEWAEYDSEDCAGENCIEQNKISTEFL